jgi:hypothetical protein
MIGTCSGSSIACQRTEGLGFGWLSLSGVVFGSELELPLSRSSLAGYFRSGAEKPAKVCLHGFFGDCGHPQQ